MVRKDSRAADGLPVDVTSLVGRQSESAEVKRMLTRSRLVTLTGPGGVGKTRLAIHVARAARGAFSDGVLMVPLAELTEPDLIASTVLTRLSQARAAGSGARDLVEHIGERQLLLVVDNCEHLADAVAGLVSALLQGCPHLRVLATSRAALRVDGEALYRVPPLALPPSGAPVRTGHIFSYDGVALFMERASVLNPAFASGAVDELAVVELCQRLDGLPLAIELAAAGARWLSLESMLARTSAPRSVAPEVSRSAPDRHRSLDASLDYSHDLCSADARTLWSRFSVFRGGADLAAVERICWGGSLSRSAVGPALFELVDKSVVALDGSRYTMLETIRQYGEDRLSEADEHDRVGLAHLEYFAEIGQEVLSGWFGPGQPELLSRVLADQANVRAALDRALADPATVRTGLGLAGSLWTFWIGCGLPGEGRHWLGRLLAADHEPSPERAHALWSNGFLSAVDGDIPAARALLDQCLRSSTENGDPASSAHALSTLGVADLFEGHIEAAVDLLEAGVAAERDLEDGADNTPYLVDALINLGLAYCYRGLNGDLDRAERVLVEARDKCLASREDLLLSWAQVFLGLTALLGGRPREAAALVGESLARKRAVHNLQGMVWAVELLAWCALDDGDAHRAALLLAAGEARAEDFGPSFHGFTGMVDWHARYARRARLALEPAAHQQATARGRQLSMDELVAVALGESSSSAPVPDSPLGDLPLTRREREIAILVATGKTNREIAEELVIAPRTVDSHVQNILTKLDFSSRSQVVALVSAARWTGH
jgi:non-specific serine/threonine protein kinase